MIVLDTHVFLWLSVAPERLSGPARQAIQADAHRAISTITAQEVAYMGARGRVELDRPLASWIRDAIAAGGIQAIAPTIPIALRAGSLDPRTFPGDPADRVIYATALEHDATLASGDQRLRDHDPSRVIW